MTESKQTLNNEGKASKNVIYKQKLHTLRRTFKQRKQND